MQYALIFYDLQPILARMPILPLVPLDDGVVVLEEQCRSMGGFAVLHILRAMGINDRRWDAESNAAVHTALALPVMLIIALLGDNVIAEEARLFGIGMRDERLLCGEFELKSAVQKLTELTCDSFSC